MKLSGKTLFQICLLFVLGRAGALAQNNSATNQTGAVRLPEVVVREKAEASPALTAPSAEAARKEVQSIPGGASVIAAGEFRTGRVSTMKDALEYTPGVFVQPRFGTDEARLSIRGSGLQRTFHGRGLKLMLDGVPVNLADGGFDMQAVEPLAASYIEVFRGANALRFGSTTLGGAINYVSPTGHDASPFQARAEYGSYNYLRGQVSSGQVLGPVDYYVSATHFSQDGFRAHSQQSNQRVFSNLGWRVNDDVESRFYYTYVLTDSELPGSLTKAQLEATPRMANAANLAGDQHRDFELHRVANKTTIRLGADAELQFNTFWSHKDLYHPIFQVIDQNSNDFGAEARYRNTGDLFGRRNELTLGLAPTWGWVESANFANVAGTPGAKLAQSHQVSRNFDLYAENQHWLSDKFSLVLGAQASWADRNLDDKIGAGDFNQDYWAVNPKVGAIYDFDAQSQLYANVSRSFEPPSLSEMGATTGIYVPRDEQKGWTLELGTRGTRGRFNWDITGYYAWLENELLAFQIPFAPLGTTATINAGSTTHAGIEAGASWRVVEGILRGQSEGKEADALVLRAAYQWNRFRFQDDVTYGNNQLPGIPEHFLRMEFNYECPCGFYIGPNIEWSAVKYPVDMAGTLFADPYALVGIKAGYRSKKGFNAFVEVRNLTDKRYAATTGVLTDSRLPGASGAQFLPGDGRAIYGGIEWKF